MSKLFNKILIVVCLVSLSSYMLVVILAGVLGSVASHNNVDCEAEQTSSTSSSDSGVSSGNASIDSFVKEHEKAYVQSWGAGGFLPSASIAQTMAETSFSMSVPSFAQAHNMGGVKWTSAATYPKTIELYGSDAVSGSGAGTVVGDNTGGGYTWFKSFDAGIVGKAEFMSRQTLYSAAINNTDGISTLNAIADGGWATDPNYKVVLNSLYQSLGSKYKWLDEKAIVAHGKTPVDLSKLSSPAAGGASSSTSSDEEEGCSDSSGSAEGASDGTGTVPADATAWGYKPEDLPESLKPYIIDPTKLGLTYGGGGWVENSGQCVDLSETLGNLVWNHSGQTFGNGRDQSRAWAANFGNSTKKTPKKGAIFSTQMGGLWNGVYYGHTGLVCHVFEDSSILVIEQNTPLSGATIGRVNTWNYRIFTPAQQKAEIMDFAYPDGREPNLGGQGK